MIPFSVQFFTEKLSKTGFAFSKTGKQMAKGTTDTIKLFVGLLAVGTAGLLVYRFATPSPVPAPIPDKKSGAEGEEKKSISEKELALRNAMRKLWAEHAIYTRQYITDLFGRSPSIKITAKRLMKNQSDIGKVIGAYYGARAGDHLTDLLKEHITIAVELLDAMNTRRRDKHKSAKLRWNINADKIADFLSHANPHWNEKDIRRELQHHLDFTTKEAFARALKNWHDDIEAFDEVFTQSQEGIADNISKGIVQQFPEKFYGNVLSKSS